MRSVFSVPIKYGLMIFLLALLGCHTSPTKTGIWKDKDIPADKAKILRQLNTDLFKAIKTNPNKAELLFSGEFLQQKNINAQFDYVNKQQETDEYFLLKDYYIVNQSISEDAFEKIEDSEINYVPLNKEMYIAFFVPKTGKNKLMLTVVYAKYNYGWKANDITFDDYTQEGKTGEELYETAKSEYAQGHLINAITYMTLSLQCLTGSHYLKAPNRDKINDFYTLVTTEANSKFTYPMVLKDVSSKPQLTSISSQSKEEGLVQYVYYLTSLKMSDTAALHQENIKVKQQLVKLFPGIDKGKKTILYSAMNEKPKFGKSVNHVDFTQEINN